MKSYLIVSAALLGGLAHASDPCDCFPVCGCGHDGPSTAPISVMGDHLHVKGEWMFSLRHMYMDMDGMYAGSNSVSPASVHAAGYLVSPTRMTMEMSMLGAMYAPSDDLTLMAMISYIQSDMDHVIDPGAGMLIAANAGNNTFSTRSVGVGDLKLTALLRLKDEGRHQLHGGFGISLPTGSISNSDILPGPGGRLSRQLPAAMQPGSGTFDLLPSLTYLYEGDGWTGGLQARGVFRTHENHHDYRLGHRGEIDAWAGCQPLSWLSVASGLGFSWDGELEGTQADVAQVPPMPPGRITVPTAFGENYGGMRLDAILGFNLQIVEAQRIGVDLRLPLWQDLNGHRLGQDLTATLGWTLAF